MFTFSRPSSVGTEFSSGVGTLRFGTLHRDGPRKTCWVSGRASRPVRPTAVTSSVEPLFRRFTSCPVLFGLPLPESGSLVESGTRSPRTAHVRTTPPTAAHPSDSPLPTSPLWGSCSEDDVSESAREGTTVTRPRTSRGGRGPTRTTTDSLVVGPLCPRDPWDRRPRPPNLPSVEWSVGPRSLPVSDGTSTSAPGKGRSYCRAGHEVQKRYETPILSSVLSSPKDVPVATECDRGSGPRASQALPQDLLCPKGVGGGRRDGS